MKKSEIKELEALDKLLLRSILETPVSTPMEAMQLELGIMSISTLIKARRINFLHYLASRNESEMLSKFLWHSGIIQDEMIGLIKSEKIC